MTTARLPCLLCLALAAAAPLAALDWATTQATLKAAPLQKSAETRFAFVNRSSRPVTITSVDTSCDCVAATADIPKVAPGASGSIRVHFMLGDRFGNFERTVIVTTDEPASPVALTIAIEVPEAASLAPRSVDWKAGSAPVEQSVEIRAADGIDLNVGEVQATSDAFRHRLEVIVPGRHFRLHLTPRETGAPANAAFRVHARANGREDLVLNAYANVR